MSLPTLDKTWRFRGILPHPSPWDMQKEAQPFAESIHCWLNPRFSHKDVQRANEGWTVCAKCWFFSLGFNSLSSTYSPKRTWNWVTPVANPAIITDPKDRGETQNKLQRSRGNLHEKATSLYFEANWIFLVWWLAPFPSKRVLLWGRRGGLVNYQDITGRKTERPHNSLYLLHEGTVRFLCHPGQEWLQCWSEILPSAGQDHMCPINYVPNALSRYPCVSKRLMHLWVNDFFPLLLKVPEAREI